MHGAFIVWHSNGIMSESRDVVHGNIHGKIFCWYDDGVLYIEREYVDGYQHGYELYYHPNGIKKSESLFDKGVLIEPTKKWNSSGILI